MNQQERCVWLIRQLLREQRWEDQIEIPDQFPQCQRLLRGLMNVRPPWPADPEWLRTQDDYLQTELNSSVIPDAAALPELEPGISLWQGYHQNQSGRDRQRREQRAVRLLYS